MHESEQLMHGERSPQFLALLERLLGIEATSVEDALAQSSDHLAVALHCDKIDIMLLDASRQTLVAVGTSDTPMGRRQRALGLHLQPLANRGRAAAVFETGEPYRGGDVRADPDELVGIREGLGVRSELIVPLVVADERRGVLTAASERRDAFSGADRHFLAAVSRWVATVLQRVELQERLAHEAEERARRVAAEELIGTLAHDLRRPLTAIAGYLDLIARHARREGREREVRYAEVASRAAARLDAMIRDLLDAERLERGLFALAPVPCDLVSLVREAMAVLRTPESRIAVQAPDELVIEADPARVRQALENLVSNAQAHAPAGTAVTVRVGIEGDAGREWAVLAVGDQGPGIPPEQRGTLFERFRPGPGSQGLGLGLYLVRGIAAAHGGRVAVAVAPGEGATFRLLLPLGGLIPGGR